MRRFVFLYIAALASIHLLLSLPALQPLSQALSLLLATCAGLIIGLLGDDVVRQGLLLTHVENGLSIRVDRACNALELVLLLYAAILAFPASWKSKFVGMSLGFSAIQGLNVVRIISLYFAIHLYPEIFDWLHEYAWRFVIILSVVLCFVGFVHYDGSRRRDRSGAA